MAYISFQPSDYFNTKLYTGDGSSSRSLTGVNFQPDWTWIKRRSDAQAHSITDSVRGVTKSLRSDSTAAEDTNNANGYVTSFDSDGFTVAKGSDPSRTNTSGATYASWNWKANGSGSANTDGSISSTVSANTTSGFSIVSFNGQTGTVGHGLGVKPSMIILKCRAVTNNWVIQHKGLTGGMDSNALIFTTSAEISAPTAEPTTSVFTVNNQIAENNDNIAYVFAERKGFSKFSSFVGNGSTDGVFCYTGFKPAFVITKMISSTGWWSLHDFKREGYNGANDALYPNTSDAEGSGYIDILSNGFKIKSTNVNINSSGGTYIYMAFSEEPLVSSNGVPATAR